MVDNAKLQQIKANPEFYKQLKSGMPAAPKTGLTASENVLSKRLSGGQSTSFGALSNSTLAANLQKTGVSTAPAVEVPENNTEVQNSATVFETGSLQTNLNGFDREATKVSSSLFSSYKTGATTDGYVSTTGTSATNTGSSTQVQTALSNAQALFGEATSYKSQADKCMAQSPADFDGARAYYAKAMEALETARQKANEAGESGLSLSRQISQTGLVYKNMYESLSTKQMVYAAAKVDSSSSSSEEKQGFWSGVLTAFQDGSLSKSVEQISSLLKGSGTSASGPSSKPSSSPSSTPTSAPKANSGASSTSTSSLKYDKENEAAVNESGLPQKFTTAENNETQASNTITNKNKELDTTNENIKNIQSRINAVNGSSQDDIQAYKDAKEAAAQNDQAIAEQKAIVKAQDTLINNATTNINNLKIDDKENAKNTATTNETKAQDAVNSIEKELPTLRDAVKNAEAAATNENPNTQAINAARHQLQAKEYELKTKQQELKNATAAREKAEATLKEALESKEECEKVIANAKKTKEPAAAKVKEGTGELMVKKAELDKKLKEASAAINTNVTELSQLKTDIDNAYNNQTKIAGEISTAKQTQTAASTEKKLIQTMVKNVEDEAEAHRKADDKKNSQSITEWFKSKV